MIKNYITTAIRNITKHKFFSIINILGLSVGIACSLFVALYILDEVSYDKFNENGDRIYRVVLDAKVGDQKVKGTSTTAKLSGALRTEVAPVENASTVQGWGSTSFLYENKKYIERGAIVVDSGFLQIFTYPLIHGDRNTAMKEPNSVVISENLAIKYFGDVNEAMNKLMVIDGDSISFKVTGVMENVPENSHLTFTALLSRNSFARLKEPRWIDNNAQTYYLLKENASMTDVDDQIEALVQKHVSPAFKEFMGGDLNEMRKQGGEFRYTSQQLYDIHLKSDYQEDMERIKKGDMNYIYILLAIGLFILVIASINFMNLSTAKSTNRAKEVGLRKTMGGTKSQLIGQFLTESMVFSIVSALFALLFVYLLLPSFNLLTGKFLDISGLFETGMIVILIATTIVVGLVAGSYPAFYLTSFEVNDVLKGKLNAGSKNKSIRGVLVTFQFWISIVLIISTAVVYKQLEYAQNKKIGVDKERVMYVMSSFRLNNNRESYKNLLDAYSNIEATSYTDSRFPGVNNNSVFRSKNDGKDHLLANLRADHDLATTLGLEVVKGRYFSKDFLSDSLAVVINEAAVAEMGWKNPLEQTIIEPEGDGNLTEHKVIGVVKNFNFESVKDEIRPLMIELQENGNSLGIRFNGTDYQDVITKAEQEWNKLVPDQPFEYTFMADDYDAMFRAEQRLKQLFTVLTGLAIFIAVLGLFGLTAFTAEQRTKEIGIRKVLGASLWQINTLLTKEFNKLVIIAFVLAIFPVYYLMSGWLDNFAYRISMSVWVFVMGGVVSIIISWITVSFQAQKAARANPVNALKYE